MTLDAGGHPAEQRPVRRVPAGFLLKRPDGKKPPAGDGGLLPPAPPAAAANVIAAGGRTRRRRARSRSRRSSARYSGGITITDIGQVSRYGTGDNARSAPPNQRLYAFKLTGAAGNNGDVNDLSSSTTLSRSTAAAAPAADRRPAATAIVAAVPDHGQVGRPGARPTAA